MGRQRATARNTKKRALTPEESTEHHPDASVGPSNEKPAKRPRPSAIIPTEGSCLCTPSKKPWPITSFSISQEAAASSVAPPNVVEGKDNSTVVLSSDSESVSDTEEVRSQLCSFTPTHANHIPINARTR